MDSQESDKPVVVTEVAESAARFQEEDSDVIVESKEIVESVAHKTETRFQEGAQEIVEAQKSFESMNNPQECEDSRAPTLVESVTQTLEGLERNGKPAEET